MIHINWIRNQKLNLNHNAAIQLQHFCTLFFYSESLICLSFFLLRHLFISISIFSLSLFLCIPTPVAIHPLRTQYSIMLAPPSHTEPVFVNLLRSPGIDSQPRGTVRQPYLTYRAARLNRLAESIPWNRFLGFLDLNVYKYGLWRLLPLHFCSHYTTQQAI